MKANEITLLEKLQKDLQNLADKNQLGEQKVEVVCSVLTAHEAIGDPERKDFPIQKGKEK